MMEKQRKPGWRLLDGLVLLLVGLLFAVHWLHLATTMEILVQISLVLTCYGLMMLWLHANEAALSREDREKGSTTCDSQLHLTEIQAHYRQVMARYRGRKV